MARRSSLTDEKIEYIKKYYPHKSNKEISEYCGLSIHGIMIYARRFGLKKSKSYISHYKSVNSRSWHGTEKFEKHRKSLTCEGCHTKEAHQKMVDKVKEIREQEKRRILFGLPQKTKLKVIVGDKRKRQVLLFLKRRMVERGYIVRGNKYYHHERTNRTKQEKRLSLKYNITFAQIEDIDIKDRVNFVMPDWSDKQGGFAI